MTQKYDSKNINNINIEEKLLNQKINKFYNIKNNISIILQDFTNKKKYKITISDLQIDINANTIIFKIINILFIMIK